MKVIKPQRLALLTKTYENNRRFYMAVNVSAFFTFDQPARFLSEVAMWKFVAEALGKDSILDAGMPKSRGEFLVYGQCHAPAGKPVPQSTVSVKVGALDKTLRVLGDRQWEHTGDIYYPGPAKPFTTMPLTYENAFGGEGYALNPVGKGMQRVDGRPVGFLPNFEAVNAPILSPDDRPRPAGMGPIDFTWAQRFSKAGTYGEDWLKNHFPGYAQDMDWSIFNAAPEDQWTAGHWFGDEVFEVSGMHPEKPVLKSKLPGHDVRCFFRTKHGDPGNFHEIPMRAETVFLFPGAERGIVLFRGVVEISTDDGTDVAAIVAAAEDRAAPRPVDHYRDILRIRLDRKQGAMHALNDAPLLPSMPESLNEEDADGSAQMMQLVSSKGLHRKNLRHKAEKVLAESKEKLQKIKDDLLANHRLHGVPLPDMAEIEQGLAMTLPPETAVPKLEELPAIEAENQALARKMISEAMDRKEVMEAQVRETCKQQNLDFDKLVADARSEGGGPPKPVAARTIKELQENQKLLKDQGLSDPALEKQLADPNLVPRLEKADAMLMALYRSNAHVFPPARKLSDAASESLRAQLKSGLARGERFTQRDFTGADLSGMQLAGADFSGAFLEGVNFSGADLRGVNFSGAVLAKACLDRAVVSEANCTGANFGSASLRGVNATSSNFSKAVLAGADLSAATFEKTDFTACDLMGAKLAGANFSGVVAPEARFIEVDLQATAAPQPDAEFPVVNMRGMQFRGASLRKAQFLMCELDDADFSGARLDEAVFLSCKGSRVNFSMASLKSFRAVSDTRLDHANFNGAVLEKANLRGTDLRNSDFTRACLNGADLSGGLAAGAVFKSIQAVGTQWVKTDLSGTDFSEANLHQSSLRQAKLDGALVHRSNLFMADLLRVKVDEKTVITDSNLSRTLMKSVEKS